MGESTLSDFAPLVDVSENVPVGGVVPGDVAGLGKNVGEKNSEGSDEVFQEENSPELTEELLSIDSQRMECTAVRRRRHNWAGRFPCGVCGKGVRKGLRCVTCLLWFHNGKTKTCAGLKNRRQQNVESYSCPTCTKKNNNNSNNNDNNNNNKKKKKKKKS